MSRLAVVGGHGFIGVELVRLAAARGTEVLVLDPAPARSGVADFVGTVRSVELSVADGPALTDVLVDFAPTSVVNLAAFGVGTDGLAQGARLQPGLAVDVNIRGAVNVLEAARASGCEHVVWSSSSTVYGPGTGVVDEGSPLAPDLVYGATKVGAEQVDRVLATTYGLRSVAVRLPLVYGSGRWYGGSQSDLVDFAVDLAAGSPARLRAWTSPADWLHVEDAAACLLALADTPAAAEPAYNVSGHRSSLLDLGQALVAAAGDPPSASVEPVAGGPGLPLMDTSRIERDLAFRPSVTTPDAGARRYLEATRTSLNSPEESS